MSKESKPQDQIIRGTKTSCEHYSQIANWRQRSVLTAIKESIKKSSHTEQNIIRSNITAALGKLKGEKVNKVDKVTIEALKMVNKNRMNLSTICSENRRLAKHCCIAIFKPIFIKVSQHKWEL